MIRGIYLMILIKISARSLAIVCNNQFASQEMDNHSKFSNLNDVMYMENDIVSAGEEGTGIVIIVDLRKIALEFSTFTSPLSSLGTLPHVSSDTPLPSKHDAAPVHPVHDPASEAKVDGMEADPFEKQMPMQIRCDAITANYGIRFQTS